MKKYILYIKTSKKIIFLLLYACIYIYIYIYIYRWLCINNYIIIITKCNNYIIHLLNKFFFCFAHCLLTWKCFSENASAEADSTHNRPPVLLSAGFSWWAAGSQWSSAVQSPRYCLSTTLKSCHRTVAAEALNGGNRADNTFWMQRSNDSESCNTSHIHTVNLTFYHKHLLYIVWVLL